ncbi:hypothetical protein L9F63_025429, partial [Diploptera punctata]
VYYASVNKSGRDGSATSDVGCYFELKFSLHFMVFLIFLGFIDEPFWTNTHKNSRHFYNLHNTSTALPFQHHGHFYPHNIYLLLFYWNILYRCFHNNYYYVTSISYPFLYISFKFTFSTLP